MHVWSFAGCFRFNRREACSVDLALGSPLGERQAPLKTRASRKNAERPILSPQLRQCKIRSHALTALVSFVSDLVSKLHCHYSDLHPLLIGLSPSLASSSLAGATAHWAGG